MNKAIVVLGVIVAAAGGFLLWKNYKPNLSVKTARALNEGDTVKLGGQVVSIGSNTEVRVWSEYRWDNDNILTTPGQTLTAAGECLEPVLWPANKLSVTHTFIAEGVQSGEIVYGAEKGPDFRLSEWQTGNIPIVYTVSGVSYPAGTTGISVHRGSTIGIGMTLSHRYNGGNFQAGVGLAPRTTLAHGSIRSDGWFLSGLFLANDDYAWQPYSVSFSFVVPSTIPNGTYDVKQFVDNVDPAWQLNGQDPWPWRDDVFVVS